MSVSQREALSMPHGRFWFLISSSKVEFWVPLQIPRAGMYHGHVQIPRAGMYAMVTCSYHGHVQIPWPCADATCRHVYHGHVQIPWSCADTMCRKAGVGTYVGVGFNTMCRYHVQGFLHSVLLAAKRCCCGCVQQLQFFRALC